MEPAEGFEAVYTMTDYWDGPRGGVASFEGRPHLYESEWDDDADDWDDTFRLSPISDEVLALALEDWEIWLRWERAFHAGQTTIETHPALPADHARKEELRALLAEKLVIDETRCLRARAEFRSPPLEVKWTRA